MSKEFIPGVGLTSPSASAPLIRPVVSQPRRIDDETDGSDMMSPSMEQFKNRDPKNIPYWSPATKLSYTDTNTDPDTDMETSQSNSNLAASAREFVPTFGSSSSLSSSSSSSSSSFLSSEATGMNSAASEWRPPQSQDQHQHVSEPDVPPSPELPEYHTAEEAQPEPLVEVSGEGGREAWEGERGHSVSQLLTLWLSLFPAYELLHITLPAALHTILH